MFFGGVVEKLLRDSAMAPGLDESLYGNRTTRNYVRKRVLYSLQGQATLSRNRKRSRVRRAEQNAKVKGERRVLVCVFMGFICSPLPAMLRTTQLIQVV